MHDNPYSQLLAWFEYFLRVGAFRNLNAKLLRPQLRSRRKYSDGSMLLEYKKQVSLVL